MFGGPRFFVSGSMAIAPSGQGGLLVRADPGESDTCVETTSARLMEMRGREMRGWPRVDTEHVRSETRARATAGYDPELLAGAGLRRRSNGL